MSAINVTSEIADLKKVLLHRPGKELLNLTPDTLDELLFDDIPFLKNAQAEHDAFAKILSENGVEVLYLEDLAAKAIAQSKEIRNKFLNQYIEELDSTLGDELLRPTEIYTKTMLPLFSKFDIKGVWHITGGGFYENIPRMIPEGLQAVVDVTSIRKQAIFDLLRKAGNIDIKEMYLLMCSFLLERH